MIVQFIRPVSAPARLPGNRWQAISESTRTRWQMATPSWQAKGQYYETCSCDFVCPCIAGKLAVKPTHGSCTIAMAFQIERGKYGGVSLDGLGFILLALTPEEMGKGNWSVGVIADERASAEQRDAIAAIAKVHHPLVGATVIPPGTQGHTKSQLHVS